MQQKKTSTKVPPLSVTQLFVFCGYIAEFMFLRVRAARLGEEDNVIGEEMMWMLSSGEILYFLFVVDLWTKKRSQDTHFLKPI